MLKELGPSRRTCTRLPNIMTAVMRARDTIVRSKLARYDPSLDDRCLLPEQRQERVDNRGQKPPSGYCEEKTHEGKVPKSAHNPG